MDFKLQSKKILFSLIATTFLSINSSALFASSSLNIACPEKYVGTVKSVEEVGRDTQFPKVEIAFEISEVLKGESETKEKKIQIIKDGPNHFIAGETYRLDINDRWLCSATLVSHK